jgi:predicted DCC family thiol-disulfide oxidoreductase YuxK
MNIVLFDGICNLCNRTVKFLIKYDKKDVLHFAAQQSLAGEKIIIKYLIQQDGRSVVLIKDGLVYYKSDAIIEIAKLIKGWPKIITLFSIVPRCIRDWVYDMIANNRYAIFGKQTNCFLPSKFIEDKFIS